jgi:hypothetical protein
MPQGRRERWHVFKSVLHYYHTIIIIYSLIIKHANLCTEHSDLLSLNNIPAAEANIERELALRDNPLLANNIPVGQVTAHQLEPDSLALASLQVHLLEAAQLLGRGTRRCALGESDVQLGNTGTGDITAVGQRDGDVVDGLPQRGVTTGHDGAVFGVRCDLIIDSLSLDVRDVEGGVRQTEAKLVADGDVAGVEVAVVNLELLVEPRLPVIVAGGVDGGGRRSVIVGAVERDGVRQVTAGVHVTVKDVSQRVARLLARVVGGEDGGDVLVVGPGESVDAGGVSDYDSVVALGGHILDEIVAIPVDAEVLAISGLFGPGLEHDNADVGELADPEVIKIALDDLSVVKEVLNKLGTVRGSALLDCMQRGDKRGRLAGARAATSKKSSELVVLLVQLLRRLSSIVTEYCDVARALERETTSVLEKNSAGSTMLANELTVVGTDVAAALARQVVLASPGLDRREGVEGGGAGVNGGEVLILTKPVVRGHDTHDHVVDASNIDGAVVDGQGDIATEE